MPGAALLCLACAAAADGPPAEVTWRDGAVMVLVPAGPFVMGSAEGAAEESPPHRRELPAFYIDRTEVTRDQYAAFLRATGARPPPTWSSADPPPGTGSLPVTTVTWFDACRYAAWAGKRLPTEAEWERAARGTDGRRYPWGDADARHRRNLADDSALAPADAFPEGASPSGCLNLSGNAWEWTADWYEPYPGTAARSAHFGARYKVIRGGGCLALYGIPNPGTCTQRARLLPWGAHDGIGFRCAADIPGTAPPYDPQGAVREAEQALGKPLGEPSQLAFQSAFAELLARRAVPLDVHGVPRQRGLVRTGFPLPRGRLRDAAVLGLRGPAGAPRPVQAMPLSRWDDGSLRWVLLSFVAEAGERLEVVLGAPGGGAPSPAEPVRAAAPGDGVVRFETGRVAADLGGTGLLAVRTAGDPFAEARLDLELAVEHDDGTRCRLRPAPGLSAEALETGPVAGSAELSGRLVPVEGGAAPAFRFRLETAVAGGSGQVRLLVTLTHDAERREPFDEPAPAARVRSLAVRVALAPAPVLWRLGTDRGVREFAPGPLVELRQPDDTSFRIAREGDEGASGTRAPGWAAAAVGDTWCRLSVRHFWQNAPAGLDLSSEGIVVRLWAGSDPFVWEAGLAKTHELLLELGPDAAEGAFPEPLVAALPPAWACGTEAAAGLLPRDADMLRTFPHWDAWRAAGMAHWFHGMPYGFRDFGDGYMGGPYKGKNAYQNLEYDVAYNVLMRFLQTGDPALLLQAEPLVRHQADIDTDNVTGRPWKHSPQHTTTEADLGHVFVRGLLLHHLLTGDRRSRTAALAVCRYIAAKLEAGEGLGNERQIGWSLYALTGALEVERNDRLRQACQAVCERLLRGQTPEGRFDIRWDNRIAFFNGIAGNGLLTVYERTRDPALARGLLRLADRTLGFYPEYACRTLNLFCWAAEHTGDPRYRLALERTWESSLEFLMGRRVVTEETHAWRFQRLAAAHGLCPLWDSPPAVLPDAASWRSLRLRARHADLVLAPRARPSRAVLVVLEGLAAGRVVLRDDRGETVFSHELGASGRPFQAVAFEVPEGALWARLELGSPDAYAWQVHRDAGLAVTLCDPSAGLVGDVLPRAWAFVREGASEIAVRGEAMGEGFHSAVLYDAAGRPLAAARQFVDFQDPGRYEVTLRAPAPAGGAMVALELHELRVLGVEGLLPWWAPAPEELVNPERSLR